MRVRAHVYALPGREADPPHMVEENEWPHHAPAAERQDAADLETAEVGALRLSTTCAIALIKNP